MVGKKDTEKTFLQLWLKRELVYNAVLAICWSSTIIISIYIDIHI